MKPDLSIIIPCYNEGRYIEECVGSVVKYKGNNKIEIILVDDGSYDEDTVSIINSLDNSRVRIIRQENKGLSAARNKGIQVSEADCFIPLDSDDQLNSEFIDQALIEIKKKRSIGVVYGNAEYFEQKQGLFISQWDSKTQLYVNGLNATALIKKEVWEKCGGYDESMRKGYEDWEFWINAFIQKYEFVKIDEIAFRYRIKSKSMVTETAKKHDEVLKYIHEKHYTFFLRNYIELNRTLHDVKNNRKLLLRFLIRNLFGKKN